jgi:hypothetical protein
VTTRRLVAYLFALVAIGFALAAMAADTPSGVVGCLAGGVLAVLGARAAMADAPR